MMYVMTKLGVVVTWHVGEGFSSKLLDKKIDEDRIVLVQVDGDELDFVLSEFVNLPYPKSRRVVAWTGDLAKFIVANLD